MAKPCIDCHENKKKRLQKTDPETYLEMVAEDGEVVVTIAKKIVSIGWKVYTLWQQVAVPKERLPWLKWLVE